MTFGDFESRIWEYKDQSPLEPATVCVPRTAELESLRVEPKPRHLHLINWVVLLQKLEKS